MFLYIELTPISTTSGLRSTGNTRKYQQIVVYIYQCEIAPLECFRVQVKCRTSKVVPNNSHEQTQCNGICCFQKLL